MNEGIRNTIRESELQRGEFDAGPGDPEQFAVSEIYVKLNGPFSAQGADGLMFSNNFNQVRGMTTEQLKAELAAQPASAQGLVFARTIAALLAYRAGQSGAAPAAPAGEGVLTIGGQTFRVLPA